MRTCGSASPSPFWRAPLATATCLLWSGSLEDGTDALGPLPEEIDDDYGESCCCLGDCRSACRAIKVACAVGEVARRARNGDAYHTTSGPLSLAMRAGHVGVAQCLLATPQRASTHQFGEMDLEYAIVNGHLPIIQWLHQLVCCWRHSWLCTVGRCNSC